MKPLHIVLLVIGAALAGGLAVKMTQAPPIPVVAPLSPPVRPPVSQMAARAPAAKPSPIPITPPQVQAPALTTAPEPVYDEPAKPALPRSKPILTANAAPTQWTPRPYETPAVAAKPALQAPSPAPAAPPTPVEPPAPVEQVVAPPPPVAAPRRVILQAGMAIPIRLDESLTSDRTVTGATFQASLVEPFIVDGLVIAERGARVTGRIMNSQNARVELGLATLATSDGQQVAISTDPWTKLIGSAGALRAGAVIRFRLAAKVTVTEQQIAGR